MPFPSHYDAYMRITELEQQLAEATARAERLISYVLWLENMGPTTLTKDHRKPFLHDDDLTPPQESTT